MSNIYRRRDTWYRKLVCAVLGHRGLVHIKHAEVCEQPWNRDHAEAYRDVVDSFCRWCDSGWLE